MKSLKISLTLLISLWCCILTVQYFYTDKDYSDVLIANPIKANLTIADAKDVPEALELAEKNAKN